MIGLLIWFSIGLISLILAFIITELISGDHKEYKHRFFMNFHDFVAFDSADVPDMLGMLVSMILMVLLGPISCGIALIAVIVCFIYKLCCKIYKKFEKELTSKK